MGQVCEATADCATPPCLHPSLTVSCVGRHGCRVGAGRVPAGTLRIHLVGVCRDSAEAPSGRASEPEGIPRKPLTIHPRIAPTKERARHPLTNIANAGFLLRSTMRYTKQR